jgi:hypothetical protein
MQLSLFVRIDGQCQKIERARHECEYQLNECRGNSEGYKETIEDLETAIKALNEAEARLQGCEYCSKMFFLSIGYGKTGGKYFTVEIKTNYCPYCGKKINKQEDVNEILRVRPPSGRNTDAKWQESTGRPMAHPLHRKRQGKDGTFNQRRTDDKD